MTVEAQDWTVGGVLKWAVQRLERGSDTPQLDAQGLLAKILNKKRSWLAAHLDAALDREAVAAFEALVSRLERGEPLPYLLGEWEFFGLPFVVTPDVLIPRPETELLVEQALTWLRTVPLPPLVLDAGTGSGCIAVSLAYNMPDCRVVATDISPAALRVARRNAGRHGVAERICFVEADLIPHGEVCMSLAGEEGAPAGLFSPPYSLIVANLPYIPTATLHTLPIFGREPMIALDGGSDGLVLIRRLLEQAPGVLSTGGALLLEIEASQGAAVLSLARRAFPAASVYIRRDLAGHDRLLVVET
jgi:release factor glutamine methyltransferase